MDDFCIFWGKLDSFAGFHVDCGVILADKISVCNGVVVDRKLPAVCSCECRTCKRAWFAKGRPIGPDGGPIKTENDL